MEQAMTKKEGVQLAQKRLKQFLTPFGFRLSPRTTDRFIRVRDEFIDQIYLYHARSTGFKLDCYIYPRCAPFIWLRCDEERLWRAVGKPASELRWNTIRLSENGSEYFETVWKDVTRALKHYVLPEMENMTAEVFLFRQVQPSNAMQEIFLPYQNQILDLKKPGSLYHPRTAGYGVMLWHLGRFEEGAPYLQAARQGYRLQLSGCQEGETNVFHRQLQELALLEELLSLWEQKEGDWMLAIQQKIDQIAADWILYI